MNNDFTISPSIFVSILNDRIKNETATVLTVTGNSMVPFLVNKRDSVILEKFSGKIKRGDILFYKRKENKCVLHRVLKTDEKGIYFIGDAQDIVEGPVPYDNVLAECNEVIRKGKRISDNNFVWLFFRHIWLNIIPLRLPIIRLIAKLKNNQ